MHWPRKLCMFCEQLCPGCICYMALHVNIYTKKMAHLQKKVMPLPGFKIQEVGALATPWGKKQEVPWMHRL